MPLPSRLVIFEPVPDSDRFSGFFRHSAASWTRFCREHFVYAHHRPFLLIVELHPWNLSKDDFRIADDVLTGRSDTLFHAAGDRMRMTIAICMVSAEAFPCRDGLSFPASPRKPRAFAPSSAKTVT